MTKEHQQRLLENIESWVLISVLIADHILTWFFLVSKVPSPHNSTTASLVVWVLLFVCSTVGIPLLSLVVCDYFVKPRVLAVPSSTFNLPSDTSAYRILQAGYFLMPTAVAEQAVNLIELKRPEWIRDYGRLHTEVLTFYSIARWLLKEILYLGVHPFRLINREIFRP